MHTKGKTWSKKKALLYNKTQKIGVPLKGVLYKPIKCQFLRKLTI
jgi:hypothetical protein